MFGDGRGGTGLDVRRRAHLERDALVADVRRQSAEHGLTVGTDRDVVGDPHAVPEAVSAAPLDRLPDRRQPERLAGVDREVRVLPLEVLERVEVPRRRVAGLRTRDVEADDPTVPVGHRELGDLPAHGLVPHGREQLPHLDQRPVATSLLLALGEAVSHRLDHLRQRQPLLQVQLGGVADLGVDHAVGRQVEDALARHPPQRLGGLHHPDGVREGLQVALQRPAVRRVDEPAPQRVGVAGRQLMPRLHCQLQDRLGPQTTVEVVVEQHLRCPVDQVSRRHGAIQPARHRSET